MSGSAVRLIIVLSLALLASPPRGEAQPPRKVPRLGILRHGSPPDPAIEVFRQALRQLGYVEGENLSIEYRWSGERPDRLPELAAELVHLKVDAILAAGGGAAERAAQQATKTIPIITPVTADPVATGLVASLARPGGNVTGLSHIAPELSGKRLELLKEAFPAISRVAVLSDPVTGATPQAELEATHAGARALAVQVQALAVRSPDEFDSAFAAARKGRAGALIVLTSAAFFAQRTRLVGLAAKSRLPTMYYHRGYVDIGGLMSYGANFFDMYRRAATYVDKILKGAKPADLPVEQPTRFELVINLKTAKALRLTIPRSVLIRADQVIQ